MEHKGEILIYYASHALYIHDYINGKSFFPTVNLSSQRQIFLKEVLKFANIYGIYFHINKLWKIIFTKRKIQNVGH